MTHLNIVMEDRVVQRCTDALLTCGTQFSQICKCLTNKKYKCQPSAEPRGT